LEVTPHAQSIATHYHHMKTNIFATPATTPVINALKIKRQDVLKRKRPVRNAKTQILHTCTNAIELTRKILNARDARPVPPLDAHLVNKHALAALHQLNFINAITLPSLASNLTIPELSSKYVIMNADTTLQPISSETGEVLLSSKANPTTSTWEKWTWSSMIKILPSSIQTELKMFTM